MSEQPDPAERILAAVNAMADAVGNALADIADQLKPFIGTVSRMAADPLVQAEVWRRQVMRALGLPVPSGCHCLCAVAHPGTQVCDGEPVTTTSRHSGVFGEVQVPTCAPCAAELMAQTR
jgi:Family of unknown function (DUF6372)